MKWLPPIFSILIVLLALSGLLIYFSRDSEVKSNTIKAKPDDVLRGRKRLIEFFLAVLIVLFFIGYLIGFRD
jgi:uncharacterized membrane protein